MLDDRSLDLNSRERMDALRTELAGTVGHLRESVADVADPRGQALLETSAEVLDGLVTAFEHYRDQSEEAWRGP